MHLLRPRHARAARAASHLLAAVAGLTCLAGAALAQIAPAASPAPAAAAPAAPSSLERAPQSAAMVDSVITVDTLIRSENQLAVARAREQSIASGLMEAPKAVAPASAQASRLSVISIFGVDGDLRANLYFNGEAYERVRKGSPIAGCVVSSIGTRSVALAPAKGRGAGSSSPASCPKAVWTGTPLPELAALAASAIQASLANQARGAAMPSPAVPTPFGGRSAAASAQPVSLIPRQAEPVRDPRLEPAGSSVPNSN